MNSLSPIEQKIIPFQGSNLIGVLVNEGGRENVYVVLRPLVESLGLDWSAQYRKVKRDPVLNEVAQGVAVTATPEGRSGGTQQMLALPIEFLNGFLFKININRLAPQLQPLLTEYQKKCYRILFDAFNTEDVMIRFYRSLGHDDTWISRRIQEHKTGVNLTYTWLKRGVPADEHPSLSDDISQGTFNMKRGEHKELKGLQTDEDLFDNMTGAELAINALAEEMTIRLANKTDAKGVEENRKAAIQGGQFGGKVREDFEKESGDSVVSSHNSLTARQRSLPESQDEEE